MIKKIFLLLIITLCSSCLANQNIGTITLKLNGITNNLNVIKLKNNKYSFNKEFKGLYLDIAEIPQSYPFYYNKSIYYPEIKNTIDYKISIIKIENNILYPLLENEYPLQNNKENSATSIVIETYQDDNTNFHFLLKYDYNKSNKMVELSQILYIETSFSEDGDNISYYKVSDTLPDSIKYLNNYNNKDMTPFIINNLYGKISDLSIKLDKIKNYSE
jgi:hypothetical protein